MEFKTATMDDFDVAFDYIEKLWDYNTYDKEVIRKVYADVLADEDSFAFFLMVFHLKLKPKPPSEAGFVTMGHAVDSSAIMYLWG